MILISEALELVARQTPRLETEEIDLERSVGRVLAEVICADMDLPPFDRSQMDGFAIKTADLDVVPVSLRIIGESVAGRGFDGVLNSGDAVRIMTGARVPNGADSVQKVELTNETNEYVTIHESTKEFQNLVKKASEIKKGSRVFEIGEIVTAQMIASMASFGYSKVKVFRKPGVTILATGSEIVDIDQTPGKDQIRNSNSLMLKVLAEKAGLQAEVLSSVRDDFGNLKKTISDAVRRTSVSKDKQPNVLILTGGVSVGDYDFTKPALRELGAEIFFEKVALKPGKPTVFARLNDSLIFGLPGNPVSVAVTFFLFVRTAIMQMQSAGDIGLKKAHAVCSDKIKGTKERDCYLPVSLSINRNGQFLIETIRFSGSSNFVAFSRADALVVVPRGTNLAKGDVAEILFI